VQNCETTCLPDPGRVADRDGELLAGKPRPQVAALLVALHRRAKRSKRSSDSGKPSARQRSHCPNADGTALDVSAPNVSACRTCGTGGDATILNNFHRYGSYDCRRWGARSQVMAIVALRPDAARDVMEALGVNIHPPPAHYRVPARGRHCFYVCSRHACRHKARAAGAQRAASLRSVFICSAAHQPGARFGAGGGRVFRRPGRKTGASAQASGIAACPGRAWQRWTGRNSISGPTKIGEVRGEWVRVYEVTPEQFGLQRAPMSAILGGDLKTNADIHLEALEGEKSPRRDIV